MDGAEEIFVLSSFDTGGAESMEVDEAPKGGPVNDDVGSFASPCATAVDGGGGGV